MSSLSRSFHSGWQNYIKTLAKNKVFCKSRPGEINRVELSKMFRFRTVGMSVRKVFVFFWFVLGVTTFILGVEQNETFVIGDISVEPGKVRSGFLAVLVEEVVKKSDCLIDLHCGDGNEALIPYCYWMKSGNKKLDDLTKEMVLVFGIKHIIIDKTRTKDISESKYLGNTAILHSKPAITTESGYLGKSDEESIVRNIRGILSVMKLFKMIEGSPEFVAGPVWIDKFEVIYSDCDGLFYPQTKMGYYVKKGENVGYVTNFLGEVCHEYRAPFTGIILYIINTPPTSKGEPLYEVGRIKE